MKLGEIITKEGNIKINEDFQAEDQGKGTLSI